jgi:hypothetical protein
MHPTLKALKSELTQIATQVKSAIPNNDPLNVAHGNWSFPGVTRDELIEMAVSLEQLIDNYGGDVIASKEALLADYVRRLAFLVPHTIPQIWGNNAALAVAAYQTTLNGLRSALEEAFEIKNGTSKDEAAQALRKLRELQTSLRTIEARVTATDSRSMNLDSKIEIIEQAHEAAHQLPTDLEELHEARIALDALLGDSKTDRTEIEKVLVEINQVASKLQKNDKEAAAILERCDAAYRATTSEGLASAFAERSRGLHASMWIWVFGLVVALGLGGFFGSRQLQNLGDVIRTPAATVHYGEIWINLLLAIFSVAAPVWFAWISTKQIGQRFRLAEDYGYKASISKAYEGYRREAALLDPAFQARLFSSALTRLDELPLRLVETETHGSPWHELASSGTVRQALSTVPGFIDRVTDLAKNAIAGLSVNKPSAETNMPKTKLPDPDGS